MRPFAAGSELLPPPPCPTARVRARRTETARRRTAPHAPRGVRAERLAAREHPPISVRAPNRGRRHRRRGASTPSAHCESVENGSAGVRRTKKPSGASVPRCSRPAISGRLWVVGPKHRYGTPADQDLQQARRRRAVPTPTSAGRSACCATSSVPLVRMPPSGARPGARGPRRARRSRTTGRWRRSSRFCPPSSRRGSGAWDWPASSCVEVDRRRRRRTRRAADSEALDALSHSSASPSRAPSAASVAARRACSPA